MKKESKIIPLGDRVLVKPFSEEDTKKTKSGIIIPETVDKERPEQGKVIAVGEGRTTDEGKVLPMKVKVGDIVIFSKYGPDEVKVDGDEYFMLKEENILAIIK
ncbi:MAG: co-chaperone GroES [Candidatus Paceibacterota bacterium]|jgi:chaperonin GroES